MKRHHNEYAKILFGYFLAIELKDAPSFKGLLVGR
jgi:hypothetical protein